MSGLNKVMLIGRLGRDPELKYTASGMAIANINLATTEKYKDEEKTEWHKIVVFDKLAEICGQYLTKGKQAYFEGKLQTREWTDKEGNKRWTTEIVCNNMVMLGVKGDAQAQARPAQPGTPTPPQAQAQSPAPIDDDDSIPF